ncbi:MAG: hypothetical protein AB7J46_04160 [Candidatus Altimarinota bacterium]
MDQSSKEGGHRREDFSTTGFENHLGTFISHRQHIAFLLTSVRVNIEFYKLMVFDDHLSPEKVLHQVLKREQHFTIASYQTHGIVFGYDVDVVFPFSAIFNFNRFKSEARTAEQSMQKIFRFLFFHRDK